MKLELKAHFKAAGVEKQVGEMSVTKFYVDIDKDSEYPSIAEFQFWGDRIDPSKFQPGDEVTVKFDIKGKKWTNPEGKEYFLQNLTAWSMVNNSAVTEQAADKDNDMEPLPFVVTILLAVGTLVQFVV